MNIPVHSKTALADALREAGESPESATIMWDSFRLHLPALDRPDAPHRLREGYIGRSDTAIHTPLSGWPVKNIQTQQDYRRFRCEKYARRAKRLP